MEEKGHGEKDESGDGVRVENKDERAEAIRHGHFAHYHVGDLSKHHYHHSHKRH